MFRLKHNHLFQVLIIVEKIMVLDFKEVEVDRDLRVNNLLIIIIQNLIFMLEIFLLINKNHQLKIIIIFYHKIYLKFNI